MDQETHDMINDRLTEIRDALRVIAGAVIAMSNNVTEGVTKNDGAQQWHEGFDKEIMRQAEKNTFG